MADDDWALSIGIGDYGARGIQSLPGARGDAERFHKWVISPRGGAVREDHARLIQSPLPHDPAKPSPVGKQIEDWFTELHMKGLEREAARKGFVIGRRLYVYLAGHGFALGDERAAALLAANAFPPNMVNHFAAPLWMDWFKLSGGFKEVVLFMDCCRTEIQRVRPRSHEWDERHGKEKARYFYAYAALNAANAREIDVDGLPMGLFSKALMECLTDPDARPLSARKLGELLDHKLPRGEYAPHVDFLPMTRDDFELLPVLPKLDGLDAPAPKPPPPWRWDDGRSLLVYDEDSVVGANLSSAVRLGGGRAIPLREMAANSGHVENLVIAAEQLDRNAVGTVLAETTPARVVVYSHHDLVSPGVGVPSEHVHAHESDTPTLARVRVRAAIDGTATARLHVIPAEPLTRLRVRNAAGEVLAEGRFDLWLDQLPLGTYRIEASIGKMSSEIQHELVKDADVPAPPVVLSTAAPVEGNPRWTSEDRQQLSYLDNRFPLVVVNRATGGVQLGGCDPVIHEIPLGAWNATKVSQRRSIVHLRVLERTIAISVPTPRGYRTEIFVDDTDISIRVVPSELLVGAPLPTDRVREMLRIALAHEGRHDLWVNPDDVKGDPIAALLVLAGSADVRPGVGMWNAFIEIAASVLGEDDEDIRVWFAGSDLRYPPLLNRGWSNADVSANSPADDVAGREVVLPPWLAWDTSKELWRENWLRTVAGLVWPCWDRDPVPGIAAAPMSTLEAVAKRLDAPPASVRRRTYKSPPIDRLKQHERIAFVGATNDQLPPALAVAFVERGKRRWANLTIWSLDDDRLALMKSDTRVGPQLRLARDHADEEFRRLLPLVADKWEVRRYQGLEIHGAWHFASLWDWEQAGKGYVHISPYDPGQDVRTTAAINEEWRADATDPPPSYAAAVGAYEALARSQSTRPEAVENTRASGSSVSVAINISDDTIHSIVIDRSRK